MTDIALVWDPVNGRADFAIANGDLLMDAGLHTSVILSLFCDRLAAAGDAISDGTDDRRGWWADTPLPGASDPTGGLDLTGSRLWLLARALQTQETLNRARSYAREALQWMIDDGAASAVVVIGDWQGDGGEVLALQITVTAPDTSVSRFTYSWAWGAL